MAGLVVDADRGQAAPDARGRSGYRRICRADAFHRAGGGRQLRQHRAGHRPRHPRGHHRLRAARLVADDVAGDGAGHPRVLRPLRPRPDPVVADGLAPGVRGADRRDSGLDGDDGGAAGCSLHQRADLARRRAMAGRLRRGGRDRRSRGRDVGCAHGRAVPRHRTEADAACSPDRRRDRRRDLRHRAAGRRHPVVRHAVLFLVPEIGSAGRLRAGAGEFRLVARARGARRSPCARRRGLDGRAVARRGDRGFLDPLRRACDGRGRHFRRGRLAERHVRASGACRPAARCGRRNGRCSPAIRGSPRRP